MEAGFPWTGGKPLNENEGCTVRTGIGMAILRHVRDIILCKNPWFYWFCCHKTVQKTKRHE